MTKTFLILMLIAAVSGLIFIGIRLYQMNRLKVVRTAKTVTDGVVKRK